MAARPLNPNTHPALVPLGLQEVPDAIGQLAALTRLECDVDCASAEKMNSMSLPAHLTTISPSISQLTALQHLTIRAANQLRQLPDVFGSLSSLRELNLIGGVGCRAQTQAHGATHMHATGTLWLKQLLFGCGPATGHLTASCGC